MLSGGGAGAGDAWGTGSSSFPSFNAFLEGAGGAAEAAPAASPSFATQPDGGYTGGCRERAFWGGGGGASTHRALSSSPPASEP